MSEVKSIDIGPEWILRVNGPGEPRCVAKSESEEQKPEIVCAEDSGLCDKSEPLKGPGAE